MSNKTKKINNQMLSKIEGTGEAPDGKVVAVMRQPYPLQGFSQKYVRSK